MNKICPNCSKEFPRNAKFCDICGTALIDKPKEDKLGQAQAYCSRCGNIVKENDLFCSKCGANVTHVSEQVQQCAGSDMI